MSNPVKQLFTLYGLMMEAQSVGRVIERDADLLVTGRRRQSFSDADLDAAVRRDRDRETGVRDDE